MEDIDKKLLREQELDTIIHNAETELKALRVEEGDYCRYNQIVLLDSNICKNCVIRCIHSGSKLEQDHLVKQKKK